MKLYEINQHFLKSENMTLYEIKQQFLELMDMDIDNETLFDTLESLQFDFEVKADNITNVIKSLEAEAEAIAKEVSSLRLRQAEKENRAINLREYLFSNMQDLNINKIETARHRLQVRKNPPSVWVAENFNIAEYMIETITRKPSKALIKEAILDGAVIVGASMVQNKRLEIK